MTRFLFLATAFLLALPALVATAEIMMLRPENHTLGQESDRAELQHAHYHYRPRNELYYRANEDVPPEKLPVDQISHILYSFANINQKGEVDSSSLRLATNQGVEETGNNVSGDIKQLYLLKKYNRDVKVLLSIGGGSAGVAPNFTALAGSQDSRKLFALSAMKFVRDWGLDGIDIDWEYPNTTQQAADFVQLLQACRDELDDYATQHADGYHFLVTLAVSAVPENINMLDLAGMNSLVDIWHVMSYDFAGPWNDQTNTTGHTTNLYPDPALPTNISSDGAVQVFLAAGIPPANISLGLPTYGRSFEKTNATVGSHYDGVGPGDPEAHEHGVWPYYSLPREGAHEYYDDKAGASYSYDKSTQELISYDDPKSVRKKAAYVRDQGLGGAFFWEASNDKTGAQSLVGTMARHLAPLDASQNLLHYPESQYDNLRAGMPGE